MCAHFRPWDERRSRLAGQRLSTGGRTGLRYPAGQTVPRPVARQDLTIETSNFFSPGPGMTGACRKCHRALQAIVLDLS